MSNSFGFGGTNAALIFAKVVMRFFLAILVVLAIIVAGAVEWASGAWTQTGSGGSKRQPDSCVDRPPYQGS